MAGSHACATVFFQSIPEDLIARYEQSAEPANGYLVKLGDPEPLLLVDATATETADWVRELNWPFCLAKTRASPSPCCWLVSTGRWRLRIMGSAARLRSTRLMNVNSSSRCHGNYWRWKRHCSSCSRRDRRR